MADSCMYVEQNTRETRRDVCVCARSAARRASLSCFVLSAARQPNTNTSRSRVTTHVSRHSSALSATGTTNLAADVARQERDPIANASPRPPCDQTTRSRTPRRVRCARRCGVGVWQGTGERTLWLLKPNSLTSFRNRISSFASYEYNNSASLAIYQVPFSQFRSAVPLVCRRVVL